MKRNIVARPGIVDDPPRNISDISGLQLEFQRGSALLVDGGVKVLRRERQLDRRSVECPLFGAGNLYHEHVVRIVVGLGALGPGRSQVDVCLAKAAEFAFKAAAKGRERGNHGIQVREAYGGTFPEKLIDLGNVESVVSYGVIVTGNFSARIFQGDVRITTIASSNENSDSKYLRCSRLTTRGFFSQ